MPKTQRRASFFRIELTSQYRSNQLSDGFADATNISLILLISVGNQVLSSCAAISVIIRYVVRFGLDYRNNVASPTVLGGLWCLGLYMFQSVKFKTPKTSRRKVLHTWTTLRLRSPRTFPRTRQRTTDTERVSPISPWDAISHYPKALAYHQPCRFYRTGAPTVLTVIVSYLDSTAGGA